LGIASPAPARRDSRHQLGVPLRRRRCHSRLAFLQFGGACRTLGIEHRRTRPYRPQTNGKAERFIQTAIREWAYTRRYENSTQRLNHLQPWTHQYNWHRPHASLNQAPPISRLLVHAKSAQYDEYVNEDHPEIYLIKMLRKDNADVTGC
jgi:hypothetical protein